MSLYTRHETPVTKLSQEAFMEFHQHAEVVALESVSSFLAQAKDAVNKFSVTISGGTLDGVIQDCINDKYEVLHISKNIKMVDFRHKVITKPESFSGLYTDYLKDLLTASVTTSKSVTDSTDRLRILIASFINEYRDDQAETVFGYRLFLKDADSLEKSKKLTSSYFKAAAGKVKTTPDEVIRNLSEISELYNLTNTLGTVLSESTVKKLDKDSRDLSDMIDSLIEHNLKSGVLTRNNNTKKELMECVHITAQLIEYYSSLYAQMLMFCNAFKQLTTAVKEFNT